MKKCSTVIKKVFPWDNACIESFHAIINRICKRSLKTVYISSKKTCLDVKIYIVQVIPSFYLHVEQIDI